MPLESVDVSQVIPEEGLGCLRGCLVEGDAEQSRRERRIRRRALTISVLFQSAVLTLLVLVPLFGKTDRISKKDFVPIPPYGHPNNPRRGPVRSTTSRRSNTDLRFTFHPPTGSVSQRREEDPNPGDPLVDDGATGNQPDNGTGCSWCVDIGGKNGGPPPPQPTNNTPRSPRIVQMTHLDPAMLMHRVEPVYPPLAIHTHREGHVELRAVIGTDGTIQSLQIVMSDPLFNQSAMEAVQQWRYRPTVLNGQPVEIDTYITVIYSMPH
jgi:periplasmic protein TonB